MSTRPSRRAVSVVAALVVAVATLFTGTVLAAPASAAVVRIDRVDAQLSMVYVYSPSMGKVIPNQVLRPRGGSAAPVFYLLNGRSGGVEGDSWLKQTDHRSFFARKNVTVVSPLGGPYSSYADWQRPDPVLGVNKWATYLLRELPAAIAEPLKTNGRNAIAGLSPVGWSRARHRRPGRIVLSGRGVVQRLPGDQCAAGHRRRLRRDLARWR